MMNANAAGDGGGATAKKVATPTWSKSGNKKETQGLILERYETGKLLGHGTFAKVYLARNVKTNEHVAIKVIDKEKILKVGLIGHIKREISILRRVRHPNIVQLFEVMATKSKIYFVMEYVKGGELFGKVAKGRLKEDVARKYFQQLISAVSFCHARGVYHRDLKPENILLDEDGNLKVSDFGLSAISDQIKQDGLFHTFCGTPAYVAPEVLARKGYDAAKVDIWSCGVILFVLIAGYLPFHDRNIMAMYKKIYRGEFKCPKWFHSDLVKFFTHLLDINPQTRMTIPEIMGHKWFRKGFKQVKFYIEDDKMCSISDEVDDAMDSVDICSESSLSESGSDKDIGTKLNSLHRPASLNAFDIISFSSGFDLSGFFEEGGEGTRFVTGATVLRIILKLEELAKVVSFTVRKKNCKINLEGPREGAKGKLTVAAEVFELTPSLRMVEVKKKAGDRSEYEEFYNSELKLVLQNLATEGVPVKPEYAEFYNYELKPGLQNLVTEGASERTEYGECYNYELKPGSQNMAKEAASEKPEYAECCNYEPKPGMENLAKDGASERPEYGECYNCELKPGTQNLAKEGASERPECSECCNYELKPGMENLAKDGASKTPEYGECYNCELKPGTQNLAKEGASERPECAECCNDEVKPGMHYKAKEGVSEKPECAECCKYELKPGMHYLEKEGASERPEYAECYNYELKPVLPNLAIEGASNKPEFNEFYNLGLKPQWQNVTMEGPSVMSNLASDTNNRPESAEETSKSIHFHEPYVHKSIPRQQIDTQAADGVPDNIQEQVNNLEEMIHDIQLAYHKEDAIPIVLPFMPELREVEMPKEFNEFDNHGLKPESQNVKLEGPSIKSHSD